MLSGSSGLLQREHVLTRDLPATSTSAETPRHPSLHCSSKSKLTKNVQYGHCATQKTRTRVCLWRCPDVRSSSYHSRGAGIISEETRRFNVHRCTEAAAFCYFTCCIWTDCFKHESLECTVENKVFAKK